MSARQDSDNLAWDRSDDLWDEAVKQVRLSSYCRKIEAFAEGVLGGPAKLKRPLIIGGFNVLYPIQIEGSISGGFLIRQPLPNQAVFPEEKTLAEAATARYIAQHTKLLVPKIFHHGVDPSIGPFIIIQDLESRETLSRPLENPRKDLNELSVLNLNLSESELKDQYFKMARCILQLAQPTFPRIGALIETSSRSLVTTSPGSQCVMGRPITLNMNNMVKLSNIPKSVLPSEGTTYQTADEWYVALAEMQIATLLFQHNDIVSSEDDCRTKYVARQLFRKLVKQGHLSNFGFAEDDWSALSKHARAYQLPMPDGAGSFRLWCDDLRPANVVINDDNSVLGVIDWEFAYAAPTQFILDSPWWLLLDKPEAWDGGIEEWTSIYKVRLRAWLRALEEAEEELEPGSFLLLSAYMRESWETGRFWLDYAAMSSWAFDTVYWKYLDERFFGERSFGEGGEGLQAGELWKTRVHLLSEEERAAMEPLVQIKMEESKERVLVDWDAEEAKQRLSSFLFD
ncbi:putative phosphotransferase [Colletotrichum sublineola]|uniref:Putative phosphotransferase n=1 Tax=Colletotrichum sublineola TaxID=1173701 RepID=A0A066XW76_COLSU|nr:putative phosphotransferase [Colletotrichum sublineola]